MNAQPVATLTKWIGSLFKAEEKQITQEAAMCLLDKTGASMNLIKQEVEKLTAYAYDKPLIEKSDVEAVCTTQTVSKIFDMISAIGNKNEQTALNLYYDLLTLKESPMRILYLIVRQFNGILQTAEGLSEGKSNSQIAKDTGNAPFVIGKYAAQIKNFSKEYLTEALNDCAKAEEDFKSGRISDKMAVEMIIIKYSR
jgi:DNA polymerase-3 subunit delta